MGKTVGGVEMDKERVLRFIDNAATHNGWKVVEDKQLLSDLAEGLLANYERFGYMQCPCRDSWGEREKDRDIICPCNYAADDIEEFGHCYCALFQSQKFFDSGEEPIAIPERRPDDKFPY